MLEATADPQAGHQRLDHVRDGRRWDDPQRLEGERNRHAVVIRRIDGRSQLAHPWLDPDDDFEQPCIGIDEDDLTDVVRRIREPKQNLGRILIRAEA